LPNESEFAQVTASANCDSIGKLGRSDGRDAHGSDCQAERPGSLLRAAASAAASAGLPHISAGEETPMTVGEIALIVIAGVFLVLALFAIVTLLKVGKTLDVARKAIESTQHDTRPMLRKADTTLGLVNTNLKNIGGVTGSARSISGNVSGLISVVVATLGGPVIRAAAFIYGVRRALAARTAKAAKKAAKKARR
jgi:hypothetical protein